jgi:hypothetical protein
MRVALFFLLLTGVTVYAFFKGGRDERLAVAICLAATLGSLGVMLPEEVDYRDLQPLVALIDIAVFAGFTWIALRSDRFWPLWVAGLQLTSTTGHLLKLLKPDMVSLAYSASLALWSYAILLILAIGTWRAARRSQPIKQIQPA